VQAKPGKASTHRSLKRPHVVTAFAVLVILIGGLVAAVKTSRLGKAQPQTSKSFAVPPPPDIVMPNPILPAPAIVTASLVLPPPERPLSERTSVATKRPRPKKPSPDVVETAAIAAVDQADGAPAPSSEVVEKTGVKDAHGTQTSTSAPSKAKPRNPIVKLGGALRRLNPFQQNNAASNTDDKEN
jgi:hypothetical protein